MKQKEVAVFTDDDDIARSAADRERALQQAIERATNAPSQEAARGIDTAVAALVDIRDVQEKRIRRFTDEPGQKRARPLSEPQRLTIEMFLKTHANETELAGWCEELRQVEGEFLQAENERHRLLVEAAIQRAAGFLPQPPPASDPTLPGRILSSEWQMYRHEKEMVRLGSLINGRRNAVVTREQNLMDERRRQAAEAEKVQRQNAERLAHAENELRKIRPKK